MEENEVEDILVNLTKIENKGGKNKKTNLEQVYSDAEQGLTYVGGSAIED